MTRALLALVIVSCSAPAKPHPAPPVVVAPKEKPLVVAPVPPGLPERLPHTFEPTRYAARLRVDPKQRGFSGTIEISGTLAEFAQNSAGQVVLWGVAIGFALFGIFCFAEAAYRRSA